MSRDLIFKIGGVVAGAVLIAFGVAMIVLAINGQLTVKLGAEEAADHRNAGHEPDAIKAEGAKAGLKNVDYPTCDVAGKPSTPARRRAASPST